MKSRSFADVKAHLSEIVDQAEHRGKRTLILRHGKPAAIIVPVNDIDARRRTVEPQSREKIEARLDELTQQMTGDPRISAVRELLEGRR